MGFIEFMKELIHDMFFVQDDHPMTEKEYDRWNAGQLLLKLPGEVRTRIREERRHNEIIRAIERNNR